MKTRPRRRRPEKKARIEIIPLIDIMFFLLASFMLVSMSMIKLQALPNNLPGKSNQPPPKLDKPDFATISVDPAGKIYLEKDEVDAGTLYQRVKKLHDDNAEVRIYIRGDKDALHGEVVTVLDRVRAAGVQKVALEIKGETPATPSADNGHVPASHVAVNR